MTSSPFAALKCDDSHYAFVKHLNFPDILSAAEASVDFNEYATKHIFPNYTTLDLNDPQNFPVSGGSLSQDQLNSIIRRIGPHVRRVELNANFSHARVNWTLLIDILSKCSQLEELILHEFESNEETPPAEPLPPIRRLRFLNCGYLDLPENFNRLPLEELELAGRWFYWPDTNGFYNKLQTLSISQSTVRIPDLLDVLQRNAGTLRCLKLTHIYRLEEYDTAGFWMNLPSLVPNVTDLSVCGREINHLTHGTFERLEVDQPLDEWLVDLLPRFSKLRCLALNYTSNYGSPLELNAIERNESLLRRCVDQLMRMGTLDELHLIVDDPELLCCIRSWVAGQGMGGHLHVFVYGRSKARQSRGETICQMRISGGVAECNRKHLVDNVSNNRCEMQQDLSNILYDDDE